MSKKVFRVDELLQENMVSQIYDATRLKLFTQGQHMREGEWFKRHGRATRWCSKVNTSTYTKVKMGTITLPFVNSY